MFCDVKEKLAVQFKNPEWITSSGKEKQELAETVKRLFTETDLPRALAKAKTLELLVNEGQIAVDREDYFQDKLNVVGILGGQKWTWHNKVMSKHFADMREFWDFSSRVGAGRSDADYGHLTPDTRALCELGFTGVIERLKRERDQKAELSEKQRIFYESAIITWESSIKLAKRLSDAVRPYNTECADCLSALTERAPETTYEAMQIIWLFFALHEIITGERCRTLGRMDVLLYPFYKKDIESGRYTDGQIREFMRYFLFKMWAAHIPFDLPFTIGGEAPDGRSEVTNAISYMIVEIYDELEIHSPKIHVRISDKTPDSFTKLVLDCIRRGHSSFLMMNDAVAVKGLMRVGIEEADARNYVPVGCYENASWGVEMPCTGNSAIAMPKAIEYVITGGKDLSSGRLMTFDTGIPQSFDQFKDAVKAQIRAIRDRSVEFINAIEKHYPEVNADLFVSGLCEYAVKAGIDVFEGSAKYNNSSLNFMGIATVADSVAAVKRIVYDEKKVTLSELFDILKSNWEGNEDLLTYAKNLPEKYGNNEPLTDSLMKEFTDFIGEITNNKPNGRGGVYKAGCYSIDRCFSYGKGIMATPDGRKAGEPFSKNLCPVIGMDKKGITAVLTSVAKIDHTAFSNGTVLDYVLHPSAVSGEDGLCAMLGIVKTYFSMGGLALHGNVFDAKILKAAQKNPEKYKNLQVRVCGWNVFFVNLSREEQDAFIIQSSK
ncbi:MAG: hypothetical protein IKU43_11940 [Clostridia bacterium]|nr:hypothetical protein [Clostridia bacterium]